MCVLGQPSSEPSERDSRAELAVADVPDQLKEQERRHSGRASHVTSEAAAGAEMTSRAGDEAQLIDANDVLKALKAFVEENNKQRVRCLTYLLFISCLADCKSRLKIDVTWGGGLVCVCGITLVT